MSVRERKIVVAGLIVDHDRFLLSQRRPTQSHPLKWELPGGKIELGESPKDALLRELREELDAQVNVHQVWEVLFHAYPTFDVLLLLYVCTLCPEAVPKPQDVHDFAWITPAEMSGYAILAADAPLIEKLRKEGVPRVQIV